MRPQPASPAAAAALMNTRVRCALRLLRFDGDDVADDSLDESPTALLDDSELDERLRSSMTPPEALFLQGGNQGVNQVDVVSMRWSAAWPVMGAADEFALAAVHSFDAD
ncbi:MAG: hypothetical protein EAZ30_09030 [Betaproteobacteria bacterium]|nr:MAG: hypothetical protein EAZ30_09030 [Betaproteobacteria bacterium]